ncbi:hypothetical protein [Endozoicomonas sp. SESOKO1]|uniref:hypothetical protein n=1 Tax=Endozoicomonas sp. SESOKO1 TaxID=2828742 RepID=UPI0021479669|nr:hypothetical protein [Endozoicomonas sp. SESOKO1]
MVKISIVILILLLSGCQSADILNQPVSTEDSRKLSSEIHASAKQVYLNEFNSFFDAVSISLDDETSRVETNAFYKEWQIMFDNIGRKLSPTHRAYKTNDQDDGDIQNEVVNILHTFYEPMKPLMGLEADTRSPNPKFKVWDFLAYGRGVHYVNKYAVIDFDQDYYCEVVLISTVIDIGKTNFWGTSAFHDYKDRVMFRPYYINHRKFMSKDIHLKKAELAVRNQDILQARRHLSRSTLKNQAEGREVYAQIEKAYAIRVKEEKREGARRARIREEERQRSEGNHQAFMSGLTALSQQMAKTSTLLAQQNTAIAEAQRRDYVVQKVIAAQAVSNPAPKVSHQSASPKQTDSQPIASAGTQKATKQAAINTTEKNQTVNQSKVAQAKPESKKAPVKPGVDPKPMGNKLAFYNENLADKGKPDPISGESRKIKFKVGDITIDELTVKYEISHFFGEPMVSGSWKWNSKTAGENALPHDFAVLLKVQRGNSFGFVKLDQAMPKANHGYGYNVTGSPDWDELFCSYASSDRLSCLTEDQAKWLYAGGNVVDIAVTHR